MLNKQAVFNQAFGRVIRHYLHAAESFGFVRLKNNHSYDLSLCKTIRIKPGTNIDAFLFRLNLSDSRLEPKDISGLKRGRTICYGGIFLKLVNYYKQTGPINQRRSPPRLVIMVQKNFDTITSLIFRGLVKHDGEPDVLAIKELAKKDREHADYVEKCLNRLLAPLPPSKPKTN